MILLICGAAPRRDRPLRLPDGLIERAWEASGFGVVELVITGGADGVDRAGHHWAEARGAQSLLLPANWKKHGRSAGMERNGWLDTTLKVFGASRKVGAIAIPRKGSTGTWDMYNRLRRWLPDGSLHLHTELLEASRV